MQKNLRMEVFASKDAVQPVSLHKYRLCAQNLENPIAVIRSAVRKLRNCSDAGVFEDGRNIYATSKLQESIPNANFSLEYEELVELPVLENRGIYCDLIKHVIRNQLSTIIIFGKYRKYSCKSSITSKWIMTRDGFRTLKSKNGEISVECNYGIWVTIGDDEKAYLKISTSMPFVSNLSVYDYMQKGINVLGMEVKNTWSKQVQTGTLVEICEFSVTDRIPEGFADSLKNYYIGLKQEYRVENLPDDTKAVRVELQQGKRYPYYPQALVPVLTREKVAEIDRPFSLSVEPYMKRNMQTRLALDEDFIKDIGILTPLKIEFEQNTCSVEKMGYKEGTVPLPQLVCANGQVIDCEKKYQVFTHGFYRKPNKSIKIGYLYPKNTYEEMRAVVNAIYLFASKGEYQGKNDRYLAKQLLDIQSQAIIKEEYEVGNITDYKRAAYRLQKIPDIDFVIALVPNGQDDENPYNPFKSVWAKANIPSQMICLDTAELFARGTAEGNKSKYYLQNIVLGILGKAGGVPWIVKDMPGDIDCFVGLDVGTIEKGIHLPACSVVFDKCGRFLGFYKPTTPQKGEKITSQILQDIFDHIVITYEERFGAMPKSILIHRDGFSNEEAIWYEDYFENKGIEYSIVEVRKNVESKLMLLQDGQVKNPTAGNCVYNNRKAYLVTTDIDEKKGSPNPIVIEKKMGSISMKDILIQIMNLSQLHIGSTHKTRLPVTTEYADKMCKNRDFIPDGMVGGQLFFL